LARLTAELENQDSADHEDLDLRQSSSRDCCRCERGLAEGGTSPRGSKQGIDVEWFPALHEPHPSAHLSYARPRGTSLGYVAAEAEEELQQERQ
jgi:hypothetical protein